MSLLARAQKGNLLQQLMIEGRVFIAGDADQNDTVTGQTTFAATTPTFCLDVPALTTAQVWSVGLNQFGTVAGGAITVVMEIDNADRYGSGGAAEATIVKGRTDAVGPTQACTLYSGATANAGVGAPVMRALVGPDVSTAEGAVNEVLYVPTGGAAPLLVGPAAFLVFTYAATTGPTWLWHFMWSEILTSDI